MKPPSKRVKNNKKGNAPSLASSPNACQKMQKESAPHKQGRTSRFSPLVEIGRFLGEANTSSAEI